MNLQRLYTFGNANMVRQIETDVLMQRWWLSSTQARLHVTDATEKCYKQGKLAI